MPTPPRTAEAAREAAPSPTQMRSWIALWRILLAPDATSPASPNNEHAEETTQTAA